MKIKYIDFGGKSPQRAHYNDAGADVFANKEVTIGPNQIEKVPLGIGLELPDGFVAFVLPRSGQSSNKGLTTEMVPIDSGYTGQIHAIVYNANPHQLIINKGDKIAQLIVIPVIVADYISSDATLEEREDNGFGSTGEK